MLPWKNGNRFSVRKDNTEIAKNVNVLNVFLLQIREQFTLSVTCVVWAANESFLSFYTSSMITGAFWEPLHKGTRDGRFKVLQL